MLRNLSAVFIKKVNNFLNFNSQLYRAESEFCRFEFVICKFNVIYINIK